MKPSMKTALLGTLLLAASLPAFSQAEDQLADPAKLKALNPGPVVRNMQLNRPQVATSQLRLAAPLAITPTLKTFSYTYVSPRDGNAYSGSIVGGDPRNNGARTTSVQTVLIPLKIVLTGTVRTVDPTAPDVGCVGTLTALQHTQQSPLFNAVPNYTINGENMGAVTFIDAFQRAQFWRDGIGNPVVASKPAYHLALPVTVAPVQTITTPNNSAGNAASFNFSGECGTNAVSSANPPRIVAADINWIDGQLNAIITNLGLNASQFPLFVVYRTIMTDGPPGTLSGNCCILGYHFVSDPVNATPANPGQTYGIAMYDMQNGFLFGGSKNISVLSHEILEWVNDPSGSNPVPPWGNIGQVGGCQNNLETGDPLSGTLMPGVLMPNGFTYHSQENAFFSWFLGTGFTGSGGKFSSHGTFGGYAKACPPGGTN